MPFTDHSNSVIVYATARDACYSWLKHWKQGGGCCSLVTWVKDTLSDFPSAASIDDIRDYLLDNNPSFCGTEPYASLVETMMGDITEVKTREELNGNNKKGTNVERQPSQ